MFVAFSKIVYVDITILYHWNLLLSISTSTITLGKNVTLSGQLVGVEEPINVTLQYMKENGVRTQLTIVRTNSTGHFECPPWKPPEVGKYYFKASTMIEGEEVVSNIVDLTVEQTETGGGFDEWLLLAIVCIILIAFSVAALMILIKRKRK
jgi:small nuclear ribonucleoprotein (snRNP)-like protein